MSTGKKIRILAVSMHQCKSEAVTLLFGKEFTEQELDDRFGKGDYRLITLFELMSDINTDDAGYLERLWVTKIYIKKEEEVCGQS